MMSEEALFAALVEEHAAAAERSNEDGIYRDMIKAQLQSENWKILKLNNLQKSLHTNSKTKSYKPNVYSLEGGNLHVL